MKAGLVDHILTQKQWLTTQTKDIYICSFEYKAQGWGKKRRVAVVRKDTIYCQKVEGKRFSANKMITCVTGIQHLLPQVNTLMRSSGKPTTKGLSRKSDQGVKV